MELKLGREEREGLKVIGKRERAIGSRDQGSSWGGKMVEVEALEKLSWEIRNGETRVRFVTLK